MNGRIITREDGRRFHLGGRRRPTAAYALRLTAPRYALDLSKWPPTPSSTSFGSAPAAQDCLRDILGNDEHGDCTEADQFHRQALRQAAGGRAVFQPSEAQVLAVYSRDGGYVDGDPSTDQGCDEVTVLTNACAQGIVADVQGSIDRPAGFIAIDATNRDLVRACVSMFVGLACCMELPDAWISPFPATAGWTWDVPPGGFTPDPQNGHCFTLADQTDQALGGWSWGMPFTLTYEALAAGAVEPAGGALYVEVDEQVLAMASRLAPDGLAWAQLVADFNDAGGDLPAPSVPRMIGSKR